LEHLDEVEVGDRPELRDWDWRKRPLVKGVLFYVGLLALIPLVIFALLLQAARVAPAAPSNAATASRHR
jgi:hypothetical protein